MIGFKGIASGDVGVNSLSVSDTKAKAVSSGLYTWYQVRDSVCMLPLVGCIEEERGSCIPALKAEGFN